MSPPFRSSRAWLRAHQTAANSLMAAALVGFSIIEAIMQIPMAGISYRPVDALNLTLLGVAAAVLALRLRAPAGVLAVVMACAIVVTVLDYPPTGGEFITYLIAVYSVAAHRGLAHSAVAGAAALVVFVVLLLVVAPHASVVNLITNLAVVSGAWWLGRSVRLRRAYLVELENRALRLERAREVDSRAARVEERSRIARELHDVVAHHVSVMTVQAGAARRILDRDPATAREAMTTIEAMGRTALNEMRRIVGVLHTERDAERDAEASQQQLAPQPGLHDVGRLVDRLRETGLAVQLWIEGESRPLSPGVDLAAYRLIQEALTNTLKHAGPQARAWVRINYTGCDLSVEVEDDGRGAVTGLGANGDSPGHGLVGMRERVALYGGELRVGPRVGGGFEVRARFPLEAHR